MQQLLVGIACLGPAEILQRMWSPEEAVARFKTFNGQNAKEYFLYTVLVELQKAGLTMTRWVEFFDRSSEMAEWSQTLKDLDVQCRISEQSLWHRKLVEMLVHLIGFTQTPETEYFHHYLTAAELQQTLHDQKEQTEFFGHASDYLDEKVKLDTAAFLRAPIDWSRAWYLKDSKSTPPKSVRAPLLATTRSLVLRALQAGTPMERRNLGFCYRNAFSIPSSAIHFDALPWEGRKRDLQQFTVGLLQLGFLCADILLRVTQLFEIAGDTEHCVLARRFASAGVTSGLVGDAEEGDFVIVVQRGSSPLLGRVSELLRSKYGNESYRITYLDDQRLAAVSSDIVPADCVTIYQKHVDLREQMVAQVREYSGGTVSMTLDESDIESALEYAVKTTWDLALRDVYQRSLDSSRG